MRQIWAETRYIGLKMTTYKGILTVAAQIPFNFGMTLVVVVYHSFSRHQKIVSKIYKL